jgi:hypothetical protein
MPSAPFWVTGALPRNLLSAIISNVANPPEITRKTPVNGEAKRSGIGVCYGIWIRDRSGRRRAAPSVE